MIEEEIIGSHTDESDESVNEQTDISEEDVFAMFGIDKPKEKQEDEAEDDPAIDPKPEPKTIKVKYNKEEVEVPEDKVPEYVQKGLALDKERERRSEYEKALDRAAKLQGFKDHAELMANLDSIEQEREQQQKDQFEQMEQKIIDELVFNGVDEQAAREYAKNNPLVKQAREALQEKEAIRQEQEKTRQQMEDAAKWDDLYQSYPDIIEDAKAWERGETPSFYTAEMQSRIDRGYDPKDAYELAHRDQIAAKSRKAAEQRLIKEQQLGLRSKVETSPTKDNEPEVSPALANAFAAFGLPVSAAKKYAKK